VQDYLSSGQIVERENIRLKDIAPGFFDWDGPYLRKRRTRKSQKPIGHRHAANMNSQVETYLLPYFKEATLASITTSKMEAFQDHLTDSGLAPATVNAVIHTLLLILREAHAKKLIHQVPHPDRLRLGRRKARGILTFQEAHDLFYKVQWDDQRAKVANMLAAATGMRLGEVCGLLRQAVHPKEAVVMVATTWEKDVGLKETPKTDEFRAVPVPPEVLTELMALMDSSPWKEPTDFVFPTRNRKTPILFKTVRSGLYRALGCLGITEEVRTQRRINFHSWRHFLNTALIHNHVPIAEVQKTTGHITKSMTEDVYFHLIDYSNIQAVQSQIFKRKGLHEEES
jgi:integrase